MKESSESLKTLAKKIREIMAEKKISQEDLAVALGSTQSSVSAMLSCKHDLRIGTINKIAIVLGVHVSQLFDTNNNSICTIQDVEMSGKWIAKQRKQYLKLMIDDISDRILLAIVKSDLVSFEKVKPLLNAIKDELNKYAEE